MKVRANCSVSTFVIKPILKKLKLGGLCSTRQYGGLPGFAEPAGAGEADGPWTAGGGWQTHPKDRHPSLPDCHISPFPPR